MATGLFLFIAYLSVIYRVMVVEEEEGGEGEEEGEGEGEGLL